jgi:hypothetical protein
VNWDLEVQLRCPGGGGKRNDLDRQGECGNWIWHPELELPGGWMGTAGDLRVESLRDCCGHRAVCSIRSSLSPTLSPAKPPEN